MKQLLFLTGLLMTSSLWANDGAINLGAHAPQPLGEYSGEESVIRMVSERIEIVFSKGESKVHCRFVFQNTKKSGSAVQVLGFPDFLTEGDTGTIRSIQSKVDGELVPTVKQRGWMDSTTGRAQLGELPEDAMGQAADFYTMPVTFPMEREVIVEREYVAGNGGSVMGDHFFTYTTQTGGPWKGTIGKAEFQVRLEGLTVEELAFEDGKQQIDPRQQLGFCSPNRSEWKIASATEMTLTWLDFEPAIHRTRQGIRIQTWIDPKRLRKTQNAP